MQAIIFVLVALLPTTFGATFNWSLVPSTPPAARNLENSALGSCPCDLTSEHCNVDCCCDPDCTTDEAKLFSECVPEPSFVNARACVDTTTKAIEIFRINHADVERDDQIPGEDAICVIRSNYPDKTDFFSVNSPVTISTQTSFPSDWFAGAQSTEAGFRAGDVIHLHTIDSSTNQITLQGQLGVHLRGKSGICSSQLPARYMHDDLSVCLLDPTLTIAETCNALSHEWYRAIIRPNSPTTTMGTVAPIGLRIIDSESGEVLHTVDPTAAFQNAVNGATSTQRDVDIAVLDGILCNFAPVSITTTLTVLTYGGTYGFMSSANQTVIVKNLTSADIVSGISLKREVKFVTEVSAVAVERSGNPGFTPGSLVMAGSLLENGSQQAISLRQGGFSLPVGDCLNGTWNAVRFLYDVPDSNCFVKLTASELQQQCVSGTKSLFDTIRNRTLEGVGVNAAQNLYVAQTGDADWRTPTSWVEVAGYEFTQGSPLPYSSLTGECGNIVIGMAVELVVGRAGSVNNPQDIIVGARADPIYGTWKFKKAGPQTQLFNFRTTIAWSRKILGDEATRSRRVIAPPVLPSVHESIFFPFRRPG